MSDVYEPLCSILRDLKQVAMQLIFISAMNVSAGYKLVYKVLLFQQTTSPMYHEEQYDIKGSGHSISKKITDNVSVNESGSLL